MGVFDDVNIKWAGKSYVLPASRGLDAVASIEEVLPLCDIVAARSSGKLQFARLAQAFGAVLRIAGARVTDEEVYHGMMAGVETQVTVIAALDILLGLMMPPSVMADSMEAQETPPGKQSAPTSSAKRSKRSSVGARSRARSSGSSGR